MLVSLTVGKVDAGVTVLLTQDKRLIEFPSILLPPNISSGSIVDIAVSRNRASEQKAEDAFASLQSRILDTFGVTAPAAPILRCRNATQTSVVLEWDPIQLATADLISLALYRNGQKAGHIPRPLQMHSTKISGLAVDTEYTFHLVLRTTAGTLQSERVVVRTHKMTDLSGITITTGILSGQARERLAAAVSRIGAKMIQEAGAVRIDTTHFVTTEGRGLAWEKATELNIPVVRPEWVEACEKNGRILGVTKFYLDAVRGPNETEPVAAPAPAPASAPAAASSPAADEPSGSSGSPATAAAPKDKETEIDEKAGHKEDDAAPEDKTAAHHGDDQKVFLGDSEKLALRPQQAAANTENKADSSVKEGAKGKAPEAEDDEDDEDEDDEDEEDDAAAAKAKEKAAANGAGAKAASPAAPGDGNSFQDVAL